MDKLPDKPTYLCSACRDVLCDDCAGIGAEYEYLLAKRTSYLIRAESENEDMKRQIAVLKQESMMWQSVAKAGYPIIIQTWLDAEIARGHKAGMAMARRDAKKSGLLAKISQLKKLINESGKAKIATEKL